MATENVASSHGARRGAFFSLFNFNNLHRARHTEGCAGGKKEEQDEGKGEAEDLGSRLGQTSEDSDLRRLKSDCELNE